MAALLAPLLDLDPMQQGLLILFGCLPPAVLNFMVAEQFRQEPGKVASIVLIGNLLSIVFVPLGLTHRAARVDAPARPDHRSRHDGSTALNPRRRSARIIAKRPGNGGRQEARLTTMRTIRATIALLALGFAASLAAAVHLVPVVGGLASSPCSRATPATAPAACSSSSKAASSASCSPAPRPRRVFLDIRSKVIAGGEQGLLGLAFHPQYASNGRFFVYYTRSGDGTLVIAEYHVVDDPQRRRARPKRCC